MLFRSPSKRKHLEKAADSLKEILDFIEDENFNIKLCLENTLPGEVGCFLEDLMSVKEKLKSEKIKFCLDTGHYNIGKKQDDILAEMVPGIEELHIHDNDGQEDEHLPPGAGAIDWRELFVILGGSRGISVFELKTADAAAVGKCLDFAGGYL